jgi:peptide/nickel transport system substrate-binding protein
MPIAIMARWRMPPENWCGNCRSRLWQALNYAVDKQGINAALLDGEGQIANCQPLSPAYFGYNPDLKPIPYDPAKAKALLAQAGFAKGLHMDLEVPTGRYLQATDIAQVIAAELGQIGVTVNIREMDFGAFMSKMMVQKDLGESAYFGLAWPTLDAAGLLDFWQSTNGEAFWSDKQFDDAAIAARSTTDAAKREALYRQATARLCASPTIFMFFPPITYAERDTVAWQPRGDDWVRAMDMHPAH